MGVIFIVLNSRRVLFGARGTYRCWDPIGKHTSNPDLGAILIFIICDLLANELKFGTRTLATSCCIPA